MGATRKPGWIDGYRAARRAGALATLLVLGPDCAPDLQAGCAEGQTDCDGVCVDVSRDADHCGSCGHDCLGGACVEASCQPVVVSTGALRAFDIEVDEANIYWTSEGTMFGDDGEVRRMSLDGGSSVAIASGQRAPRGMAVDGLNVYWANGEGDTVMSAPKAGGAPVVIADGQSARDVVVDATHVYWTNLFGEVMKAAIDGSGTPFELFSDSPGPDGIALDATHVYWVNRNEGLVMKVPIHGPMEAASVLFEGQESPSDIAVDATHVYWTNHEDGEVLKVPLEGGEDAETVIAEDENEPFGIAVDATHVYWVNYDGREVRRAPIEGGAPVSIATGQIGPRRIVVDAAAIYWTNHDSGEIVMLAK